MTPTVTIPEHILDTAWLAFNNTYEHHGDCPTALADAFTAAAPLIPLELARDLLIRALQARRYEQLREQPELALMPSTFSGAWATTEADRILGHIRRIQAGDL